MNRELVVHAKSSIMDLALLEEGRLVELHQEQSDIKLSVGDIFLAKITRILPGLNATFVNIGHRKEGFLHYSDLGPQVRSQLKYLDTIVTGIPYSALLDTFELEPLIEKQGKINEVFFRGRSLLVQVTKEPISTKGPRLTSEVTLAGRFLVLVPFNNQVSVSRRIKHTEERNRLKELFEKIRPLNFGLIVRTAAEGQAEEEISRDLKDLLKKWEALVKKIPHANPPQKIQHALNKSFSILRDLLSESFQKITVNDAVVAQEIKKYLGEIAPDKTKIVEVYKGKIPIFDSYKVSKQIKSLFGKTVNIPNGAYLIFEETEAMYVIDVNSGHKVGAQTDQEKNSLAVNLASADEIARQLRLRDIGGIIIIDFIDMKVAENRKIVWEKIKAAMMPDRARHTILPLTKFGLMQITRQRVRPTIHIETSENCPSCNGTGKIRSTILIVDEIEDDIDYLFNDLNYKKLRLVVHPYIEAFLKKGWYSQQMKWFKEYKKWVSIQSDLSYSIMQYQFFGGEDNGEIKL